MIHKMNVNTGKYRAANHPHLPAACLHPLLLCLHQCALSFFLSLCSFSITEDVLVLCLFCNSYVKQERHPRQPHTAHSAMSTPGPLPAL